MNIAFVGCGFVFDIYMRTKWAHPELQICGVYDIDSLRAATVGRHYGLRVYPTMEALLADPDVQIVVNLTNIRAHYEVTKRALLAGKHVYSEKPLTTELAQTEELFALALARGLTFSGAPCNVYSDSVGTLWKAVRDGAIGRPLLVYAELDDNPWHLMDVEKTRSPSGAPWPYAEELQEGCTFEHVGYHLVWICALFGPVTSLTAFSKQLMEHHASVPLRPADTPDFSVACLNLASGVTARITCSIIAPRDQRLRIIGDEGEIAAESYSHYQAPVHLERFSKVSLTARKMYDARVQPLIGRLLGVGGRRLPLVRHWKSHAVEAEGGGRRSLKQKMIGWVRRRQVIYAQDKLLGIAEMARSLREARPQPMTPEFLTHVNELTLLIQRAGPNGIATAPKTTFMPLEPLPEIAGSRRDYRTGYRRPALERLLAGSVAGLRDSHPARERAGTEARQAYQER